MTRIGPPATQFPGSMALGAGRSAADARTAAAITGRELLAMGVNTNFAPVCDVNVNPLNPVIGTRSFCVPTPTSRPSWSLRRCAGYQRDGGVSSSAKHFPGHGDTATDSHVAFPIITHTREQWESIDAPPFKAAINEQIDMIMTAHLSFPALDDSGNPATLSKPIMTGVLREELGYEGVIVTDSLAMQGVRDLYGDAEVAVRALLAGVDQLLMTPAMDDAYAAVIAAVRSGRITAQRARRQGTPRARPQVPPRHRRPTVRRPGRGLVGRRHACAPRVGELGHRPHDDARQERRQGAPDRPERQEGPRHRLRRLDDGDARGSDDGQGRDGPDRPDRHVARPTRRSPPPSRRPPTRTSSSSRR